MYITESLSYNKTANRVHLVLIWKTQDNAFKADVFRYRNGVSIASLHPSQFSYSRRGEYLVASSSGDPLIYPFHWAGLGEWRVDRKIRGNVRGCV